MATSSLKPGTRGLIKAYKVHRDSIFKPSRKQVAKIHKQTKKMVGHDRMKKGAIVSAAAKKFNMKKKIANPFFNRKNT